jgi:tripartite-type tricarboxylate transporter receptor subunit TctC
MLCLAALVCIGAAPAAAQDYPTRDIQLVVGFPPGSGADVYARFYGNKLQQLSGRTVIVANRPGVGGVLAAETVARARPDGHTLFIGGAGTLASAPWLFKKPTIDPKKDFIYIAPLLGQAFILSVDAATPYKTVADLTAAMKQKKDKASYATPNNSSTILAELYKQAAGLETTQVNYRTSADFLNDMYSGRIDWVMADPVFALARINEGKMRPLGVSTAKRISAVPDLPTLQEGGVPGINLNLWWQMAAPAATPAPIIEKLNDWLTEIGKQADTSVFLARNGADPMFANVAATKALIDKELVDWERYVKVAKIEPQ